VIRKRFAIGLLAAGTLAAPVLTPVQPASSTATPQKSALAPGLGSWVGGGTDFVGFYLARGGGAQTKVYCIRPDSAAPTAIALRTVSRLPGSSPATTRLLAETLSAHGDAQTAVRAAAVSQALNEEVGNHRAVQRRAAQLSPRVRELTDRYVAEAHALAGPSELTLDLPRSPLPGQSARGSVTLTTAAGPRRAIVQLRHTPNVRTPGELRLGRDGRARFTYATTGGGPVRIAATATVPPTRVRASSPAPGTQLMVTAAPPAEARATATYQPTAAGIGYRYACDSQCDGAPVVTLRACAPASDDRSRIVFHLGDRIRRIGFAAAAVRICKSRELAIADGERVTAAWRYRTPHGWSRAFPAPGSFVVDCPPAPPVAVLVGYDCTDAQVSVVLGKQRDGELRPLRNTTGHPMFLIVTGSAAARFAVPVGSTATAHTLHFACGTGAGISVRGAVQRTGGGLNYGEPLEVSMP
jgi:hypothetical protein